MVNETLRILQVSPFFYPSALATGPANIAWGQSRELVRRGHEVVVYTSNTNDSVSGLDVCDVAKVDGITVRYFPSLNHQLAADHRIIFTPKLLGAARSEFAEFDVVHLHDYRTFNNVVVSIFANRSRVPYVLQAHGTSPRIVVKLRLKRLFDLCFGQRLLEKAARLIALSPLEREQYLTLGVSSAKIVILPNAVELPRDLNAQDGRAFRNAFRIENDVSLILFLGRIHKVKGLAFLLEAFRRLTDELPRVLLVIAGPDDGYMGTLQRLVAEHGLGGRVILTGKLKENEKWSAIQASDVLVLPSEYEMFPLVILEAWAVGRPVISTPQNGLAAWIQLGGGLIVPRDEQAFACAMREILTDPKLRARLGRDGNRLVEQNFTWDHVIRRLEHLYFEMIGFASGL